MPRTPPTSPGLEYLAAIYARLAEVIESAVSWIQHSSGISQYQVAEVKGDSGNTLPLISISAFATTPLGQPHSPTAWAARASTSSRTRRLRRLRRPRASLHRWSVKPRPVDAKSLSGYPPDQAIVPFHSGDCRDHLRRVHSSQPPTGAPF